jgi:hypothetical protein
VQDGRAGSRRGSLTTPGNLVALELEGEGAQRHADELSRTRLHTLRGLQCLPDALPLQLAHFLGQGAELPVPASFDVWC